MSVNSRRNSGPRTRMLLTLQLAVVLPAAALIAFTLWNLKNLQRDRAVEAAIQRDFSEVLQITEKRLNEKAFRMIEEVRSNFPCPTGTEPPQLEPLLQQYPQFAHVFAYGPQSGLLVRSREGGPDERSLRSEHEQFARTLSWFHEIQLKAAAKQYVEREERRKRKEAPEEEARSGEKRPLPFPPGIMFMRDENKAGDSIFAVMTLPRCADSNALGGIAFDPAYLRNQFFPSALDEILSQGQGVRNGNPAVMMVRWNREHAPLAASTNWDGGKPEAERRFEEGASAFPMLVAGIKLRGTTIAALSQKFLWTNSLIIGGISAFLLIGIWQTYRNVNREMALARLKSDFVANVSHELRTPLSLIRLYAETLEMGRLTGPEKPQEYYRIIRKESERLTALINNILDFSRIEAGRKEYEFRETDLAELVRNTLEAYRYQIEQNGFTFQVHIEEDLPPVQVDREAIARSLVNLINNALKYSPAEKFLEVKAYRAGSHVKLEVVDHGMGIPRGEQTRIFEKFYRVSDPLVHNTKGSGLGLSLVRHIVRAHDGEIVVESTPGVGSKFIITLPFWGGRPAVAH